MSGIEEMGNFIKDHWLIFVGIGTAARFISKILYRSWRNKMALRVYEKSKSTQIEIITSTEIIKLTRR